MRNSDLYTSILDKFRCQLYVLEDKPDETPESTLSALWYTAAGNPKSVQLAQSLELPTLNDHQIKTLFDMVEQRLKGTPLAHITKRQQFMGIELLAGPEALVPRRETEILGRAVLEILDELEEGQDPLVVKDVCTGAGNLAIAFAVYAPDIQVFAGDLSEDAVKLAKKNAEFAGVQDRVEVRVGDLLEPFNSDKFLASVDILSCNPPYISSRKVDELHPEIYIHEPRLAFDGGPFGIKILQRLIQEAPRYLKSGGWLAFEVGVGQGAAWIERLNKHVHFSEVRSVSDDMDNIRAILARRT